MKHGRGPGGGERPKKQQADGPPPRRINPVHGNPGRGTWPRRDERPTRPEPMRRPDVPRDVPPHAPPVVQRDEAELHEDVRSGRTVYGIHALTETLAARADTIEHLYVQDGRVNPRVQALIDAARGAGVSVRFVDRERLRLLCGTTDHQGVVARVGVFAYAELEDLLGVAAASGEPLLVLALDGVQDPRNLGAILRSAEAMGAHGVVIPKERAAGVTPVAAKVAAGAAERIPVARVTNLVRALEQLKKAGAWIVGASAEAPGLAASYDFKGASVIVVGGEEKGLRPLVARACDAMVQIPLSGVTSSLNASIAAAILVYEARRQRGAGPKA